LLRSIILKMAHLSAYHRGVLGITGKSDELAPMRGSDNPFGDAGLSDPDERVPRVTYCAMSTSWKGANAGKRVECDAGASLRVCWGNK